MVSTFRSVQSLLVSVAVLLAGHGLQLTLLPLQGKTLGWTNSAIGLMGSTYYFGFIVGCLTIPRLIRRVGHIRVFAVTVALASMVLLAASAFESYPLWLGLRMFTGWSMAGLYMVIESWLNDRVENSQRGSLMGFYTMISLGAMVAGQLLLEIESLTLQDLFPIAGLLIIGAIIPVALTSRPQPSVPSEIHFSWRVVYDASHVGLVSAGLSGLVMGLMWSLGAVYASELTGSVESGARFIVALILGGLLLQFPIGRLSDRFDRRWVILGLGLLGITGSCLWLVLAMDGVWLYLSAFLCGGAAMPMYSISIAHANDNASGRFLQIASGMLMANAVGAMIGPMVYGVTRYAGLSQGFMIILTFAFACCVIWTALRIRTHTVTRSHFEPYQPLPKTSIEVTSLDPRMDSEASSTEGAPT